MPSSKPFPAWRLCLNAEPWSLLWSKSDRGAIDLDASDPVAQALREHWQAQLDWLAGCAVVGDVGSGPAVLPRMLLARHAQALESVHWICVDSAQWPLAHEQAGPRITLRTGQNFADALPPPGGVDALVSNFGLEYLPREAAAEASWAWLAGGARLHAVVHARGSVIDTAAEQHRADLAFALGEARLFPRAAAMLQALASAPADPVERMMHAIEVRDDYNLAVNALKARMEAARARSAPLVDMLQGIATLAIAVRSGQVAPALQALGEREAAYRAECARLEAMRASALDENGASTFLQAATRAGLRDPACQALESAVGQVAWVVSARKP
ncbi:MAG: class I SAM-dependent methyltransferase [Rubrivivax sp.]